MRAASPPAIVKSAPAGSAQGIPEKFPHTAAASVAPDRRRALGAPPAPGSCWRPPRERSSCGRPGRHGAPWEPASLDPDSCFCLKGPARRRTARRAAAAELRPSRQRTAHRAHAPARPCHRPLPRAHARGPPRTRTPAAARHACRPERQPGTDRRHVAQSVREESARIATATSQADMAAPRSRRSARCASAHPMRANGFGDPRTPPSHHPARRHSSAGNRPPASTQSASPPRPVGEEAAAWPAPFVAGPGRRRLRPARLATPPSLTAR
jgi:hypothetical protein